MSRHERAGESWHLRFWGLAAAFWAAQGPWHFVSLRSSRKVPRTAIRSTGERIYTAKLKSQLPARLAALCLKLEQQSCGRVVSNCGGWQSRDLTGAQEEGLLELMGQMHQHLAAFLEPGCSVHAVPDQLWANINRPGNFNKRHDHGSATASLVASGVFYCACSARAPLRLFSQEVTEVEPEPGMLVLFPPYVEHEVDALPDGAGERISIAFNLRARWLRDKWHRAAVEGDLQAESADINAVDCLGLSALHLAAEAGHRGLVQDLLARRAQAEVSYEGWSPLGLAADRGHIKVMELLLAHKESETPKDEKGMLQTGVGAKGAAAAAARRGHLPGLRLLPATAAALGAAAAAGEVDCVEHLLARRVDPNAKVDCRSPLHQAAGAGHAEVLRRLLHAGASLNLRDEHEACALHEAAAKGHLQAAKELLTRADPDLRDEEGASALHWAASKNQTDIVQLLLASDAAMLADAKGASPLHWAAKSGHGAVVELLCTGWTSERPDVLNISKPVMRSGSFWSRQRFAEFLSRAAAVDAMPAADRAGSPHHAAAAAGHVEVVRLLRGHQDVEAVDSEGALPLHWAAANGHERLVLALLQETGRSIHTRDGAGSTALHDAAWGGHLQVAEVLLQAGAAVNARDSKLHTPLHAAAALLMDDLVNLLLAYGADPSQPDLQGSLLQATFGPGWGDGQLTWPLHREMQTLQSLADQMSAVPVTEEQKLAARAKRWGLTSTAVDEPTEPNEEKLAARAKRWGLPARPKEPSPEKAAAKERPVELEAKKDLEAFLARKAAKNGRSAPPDSGRRPRAAQPPTRKRENREEPPDPEEDERRKRRAQRFAMK
ncbi:unnamed protein product [Effrenium voratum]|nr:unnamed protein product [Effrenium voratum]